MITHFRVRNYKALRDVSLALTPIHVLIGPNDSGKTSLLEAMRALCRTVHYPLEQAFDGRWQGRELVWRGESESPISFGIVLTERAIRIEYELACAFAISARAVRSVAETGQVTPAGSGLEGFSPAGGGEVSYVAAAWQATVPHPSQRTAKLIHDALYRTQFYRWVPSHLALPVAFAVATESGMEPTGFGLAMYLNDILTNDHVRFGELEERFRALFPQIARIRLRREQGFTSPREVHPSQPGLGVYFEAAGTTDLLPASRASDGLLLVLAYLAILYSPEPPRLLLIEEPENGIHPGRLENVLTILKELVKDQDRTQVVLTTHSPYAVDVFQPAEVTLCRREPDGSATVHRLSESKRVREQVDIFSLGEIWTAEGDEALAASASPN
jgi:predicted ATPase